MSHEITQLDVVKIKIAGALASSIHKKIRDGESFDECANWGRERYLTFTPVQYRQPALPISIAKKIDMFLFGRNGNLMRSQFGNPKNEDFINTSTCKGYVYKSGIFTFAVYRVKCASEQTLMNSVKIPYDESCPYCYTTFDGGRGYDVDCCSICSEIGYSA